MWIGLEGTVLSELIQMGNDKCCMSSYVESKTIELIETVELWFLGD